MQIVIEIPKYIIDMCKASGCVIDADVEKVGEAIANGTPLPEHFGELIERDKVLKSLVNYVGGKKSLGQCIDDVPTIIEATEQKQHEREESKWN